MAGKTRRLVDSAKAMLRKTYLDHVTPESITRGPTRQRVPYSELELAYSRDPVVYHGVNKKSRDVLKKWHTFEAIDPNEQPDPDIVARLEAFARRVNLRQKLPLLTADTYVYGDGYLELVYNGDERTLPEQPPVKGKGIADVALVAPHTFVGVRQNERSLPNFGDVSHFEQLTPGSAPTVIHKDRIRHLRFYDVGDDTRGLGAIEAAYYVSVAKQRSDRALGDYVVWESKGFYVMTIQEATDEELTKGYEMLAAMRAQGTNFVVGSDRHSFDIKNPAQMNIAPFYDVFYFALACALDMPKDVLIGASAGAITGSETNLRDYYEDCDALLNAYFTPLLESLYATELGIDVADFPVRIKWNPLYVNEQSEADTKFKVAQAWSIAHRDGVITGNEYRAALGLPPHDGLDDLLLPATPTIPTPTTPKEPGGPNGDVAAAPAKNALDARAELLALAGDTESLDKLYSADQPRDDNGRWASEGGEADSSGDSGKAKTTGIMAPEESWPNEFDANPPALKSSEVESIQRYTGSGHLVVNDELRRDAVDSNAQMMVEDLDNAIARQPPFSKPVTVYRGVIPDNFSNADDLDNMVKSFEDAKGQEVQIDRAFLSTSTDPTRAANFSATGMSFRGHEGVVYAIEAKKGIPVANLSQFRFEHEVILPRDSHFIVKGVERNVPIFESMPNAAKGANLDGLEVGRRTVVRLEQVVR